MYVPFSCVQKTTWPLSLFGTEVTICKLYLLDTCHQDISGDWKSIHDYTEHSLTHVLPPPNLNPEAANYCIKTSDDIYQTGTKTIAW